MRGWRGGLAALLCLSAAAAGSGSADDRSLPAPTRAELVKQANAPISSIFQLRLFDTYLPAFTGAHGQGNVVTTAVTMPLPEYRLLPFPQLSLLTVPGAVTTPAGLTGFGDVRFVDVAILDPGHRVVVGVGPSFVFPTASEPTTGQGKWQAGPAAAIAFTPRRWVVGALAQNPISFGGSGDRKDTNALFLVPFITYQLGGGWFVRSQPQMAFDWKSRRQVIPIDLGGGRLFTLGRQQINCFVEPFWNASTNGPTPTWGITFGISLLYPNFWETAATESH